MGCIIKIMNEDIIEKSDEQESPGPHKVRVAGVLLLVIVSVSAGFIGGYFGATQRGIAPPVNVEHAQAIVSSESDLITKIAKDVGPSVVSINTTTTGSRDTMFGSRTTTQESAGTGVIIDDSGIIITNRHVVPKGTTTVSVTLSDGTELKNVEVLGRTGESDPLDVAFLKIKDKQGHELKSAKIGDSTKVQVGEKVVAIGNALGEFQNTVTAGIISGYGRSVEAGDEGSSESLQNLFQTDAAINQGNSGGPLVNMKGEVIGINTAVAGDAQNIGFSMPITDLQGLIKSVLKTGKLERPYLGVRYVMLNEAYAKEFKLDTKDGAYIAPSSGQKSVITGSPADKAGLKEKDIITKVNDANIDESHSLTTAISRLGVGDKAKLAVVRDGKTLTIEVALEAMPTE